MTRGRAVQLDRDSPDPLYRQIEAGLAYDIVTGKRSSGSRLPSLRQAAATWGVNLHTVRRAYRELELQGLVETKGGGTRVGPLGPDALPGDDLDAHVRAFAREARERFGVPPATLAMAFQSLARASHEPEPICVVVECSATLSRSLAEELENRFAIRAEPLDLLRDGDLPGSTIVGTYFHAEELRDLMAGRLHELRLVRVRPQVSLLAAWAREVGAARVRRVVLLDRLPRSAGDLSEEIGSFLGPGVTIETRILRDPLAAFPESEDGTIVVATPQTWDRLPPDLRERHDVRELRYEIEPADRAQLAESLGWTPR